MLVKICHKSEMTYVRVPAPHEYICIINQRLRARALLVYVGGACTPCAQLCRGSMCAVFVRAYLVAAAALRVVQRHDLNIHCWWWRWSWWWRQRRRRDAGVVVILRHIMVETAHTSLARRRPPTAPIIHSE